MKKLLQYLLVSAFILINAVEASTLLIGGARADIDVDVEGLSLDSPSHKKRVDTKPQGLPDEYKDFDCPTKGKFAQALAHKKFFSLKPKNSYGSEFRVVACNGTYAIKEGNGYDGFYVVLDNDHQVARFSAAGGIVQASTEGLPIIIINESKAAAGGRLSFGKGISLADGQYAAQMSEAWVRIVANTLITKKAPEGKCAITDSFDKEPSCRYAACGPVYDATLESIVGGAREGLQSVFRTATVLDDEGNWAIYALGHNKAMVDITEALLKKLFS